MDASCLTGIDSVIVDERIDLPLRGLERLFSLRKGIMIAHVISLSGPAIDVLIENRLHAWSVVVDRYPRLRARVTGPCQSVISTSVSYDQLSPMVSVVHVPDSDNIVSQWHSFVESRCNQGRPSEALPASLTVMRNSTSAILILLTDHCFSDGMSGLIILNCFLEASLNPSKAVSVVPLTACVLNLFLPSNRNCCRRFYDFVSCYIASKIVLCQSKSFRPLLPLASRLRNLRVHDDIPGFALFGDGSPAGLLSSLAACRRNSTTIHGAVMVMTALAIGVVAGTSDNSPFRLHMDVDYNLRNRVKRPLESNEHVGLFVGFSSMSYLHTSGIRWDSKFWDEARRAKNEATLALSSPMLTISLQYSHSKLKSEEDLNFILGNLEAGTLSDVNISNMGRYPFPLEHANGGLRIESVYLYNSCSFGPALILFINSTNRMHFSLMYKTEEDIAKTVFNRLLGAIDAIGSVSDNMTIADVIRQVFKKI